MKELWRVSYGYDQNKYSHFENKEKAESYYEGIGEFGPAEIIHFVEDTRVKELEAVVNKIYFLGSGSKAYTSDFTTEVMGLIRGLL